MRSHPRILPKAEAGGQAIVQRDEIDGSFGEGLQDFRGEGVEEMGIP